MTAKKSKRKYTDEELKMIEDRSCRERLAELVPFMAHYPPAVVKALHDNLLKHIIEQLPKADRLQVSNDLFTLNRYVEMHPGGKFDPDTALPLADFCGVEEIQEAIGHVLTIMHEDERLDQWT